jgi:CheY-like chemotaxis protein
MIEDDDAVRGLFRAILEPVGYVVSEAATAWEGIGRYREVPTDLVLTDVDMPGGTGMDVVRQLRADYPGVKILVVSGSNAADELRREAHRLGADAILGKPVGVDELRSAVALVAQGHERPGAPPFS